MQEKILVIQTAFLGDAILTLPMIQKLSGKFDSPDIHVLAIPSTKELFEASPFVNRVIVLDKRGEHKSLFSVFSISEEIKKTNYTRLYSPHRSFRSSLITLLSGIRETYGFDTASLKYVYKHPVKYERSFHEVQRNLSLIDYEDSSDWKIKPEIKISNSTEDKIESIINSSEGKKNVAVAPGSVWETKRYPSEYWTEIIGYLSEKNCRVFLIGGREDIELSESLKNQFNKNVVSLCGQLSVPESIALLKKCGLLICNDSAPTHMGMAADIPVLTIFCSTVPEFGFYPYSSQSKYLSYSRLECKPCGIHGHRQCPIKTFDCAILLKPDVVIAGIEEILYG